MKNYHAPFTYECFYHIYNQGNNKENLFSNDGNYLFFLQQLVKYLLPYLKFYTYCLMPNHFHLLVQVREKEEIMRIFTKLSKVSKVNFNINKFLEERFQRFFSSYSLAYNKQQGRTGSLFQKRFKRIHIDSDKYKISSL